MVAQFQWCSELKRSAIAMYIHTYGSTIHSRTCPLSLLSVQPCLCIDAREPVAHTATQVWEPSRLPDSKVEQFLVVARLVDAHPLCSFFRLCMLASIVASDL